MYEKVYNISNYTYFSDAMDLQFWTFACTVKASTAVNHNMNKDIGEVKIQSEQNKTNEYIPRELIDHLEIIKKQILQHKPN
jgi:hypothetical protein